MAARTAVLVAAALVACVQVVAAANDTCFVQTPDGPLTGLINKDGTREWLGVPFATPPVGDLRWKAPQPVTPWTSNYDAFFYKPACYQSNNTFTVLNKVSEDCLYLNVYAPPAATSTNLPVMIFFYGGSWNEGAASFALYDGMEDVHYSNDVIMVTANYRLNVFGFLGSSELAGEDPTRSTGNNGLQDQRQAMRWVKKNIAAFGGNPNNVMIFGESAGAGSVSCHLIMPQSGGLFERAAMESGPIADWTAKPLYAAQNTFNVVAKNLGCSDKGTPADVLSCMRAFDSYDVFEASKDAPGALMHDLVWSPVIDGVEIEDDPRKLAAAGKFNKVPVLLGTNMDEGTLFVKASHDLNTTGMAAFLVQLFGEEWTPEIMNQYPLSNYSADHPDNTAWWALTHVFGDSQMSCPARQTARWLSEATGQPVYLYFFDHILEIIKLFVPFKGCCHGSELPFVFDLHLAFLEKGELALAEQFVRYWTRFAATGNPNGGGDPEWPAYKTETDMNMELNLTVSAMTGLKSQVCDFWDAHQLSVDQLWKNTTDTATRAGV